MVHSSTQFQASVAKTPEDETNAIADLPDFELIEAFFFAYRDFVAEPDRTLSVYGFGRAHHRVLHFVYRNSGLTIASLLSILQITKQSLARVLKDLVEGGFINQQEGADDRRQRLLFTTDKGQILAAKLAKAQSVRVHAALANIEAGLSSRNIVKSFLTALIETGSYHS